MSKYYQRRWPKYPPDFESRYWSKKEDPDGATRDHESNEEREKKLDDLREELAFISSLPPGRIMDIGCGCGFLLSALSDEWLKYGVEPSDYARDVAEKENPTAKIYKHAPMRIGNEELFDVVTMYHVIEHVIEPESLLKEALYFLKPGGWLIIGTPDFDSPVARLFGDNFRLLHDQTHISLFSREGLLQMLRDHGLQIERVETPFFETRHFTKENVLRLLDYHHPEAISPPAPGNIITVYARKGED